MNMVEKKVFSALPLIFGVFFIVFGVGAGAHLLAINIGESALPADTAPKADTDSNELQMSQTLPNTANTSGSAQIPQGNLPAAATPAVNAGAEAANQGTQNVSAPEENISIEILSPLDSQKVSDTFTFLAKSSKQIEGLTLFLDNLSSSLSPDTTVQAQSPDGLGWSSAVRTHDFLNGRYIVSARGMKNNKTYNSTVRSFEIYNAPPVIEFHFLEPMSGRAYAITRLLAESNIYVDSAVFLVSGKRSTEIPALLDHLQIKADLDTKAFPDGEYSVIVQAKKNGNISKSDPFTLLIQNTPSQNNTPTAQTPAGVLGEAPGEKALPQSSPAGLAAPAALTPLTFEILSPKMSVLSGTVSLKARPSRPVDDCIFILNSLTEKTQLHAQISQNICGANWDTSKVSSGPYSIRVLAQASGSIADEAVGEFSVENKSEVSLKPEVSILTPPRHSQIKGVENVVIQTKDFIADKVFLSYKNAVRESIEEHSEFHVAENIWKMNWDTRFLPNGEYEIQALGRTKDANILSEAYTVSVNNPTQALQESALKAANGIEHIPQAATSTPASVQKLTDVKPDEDSDNAYLRECALAGVQGEDACRMYFLRKSGLGDECITRNIHDLDLCKAFQNLPESCRSEGIYNHDACQRYVFQKNQMASQVLSSETPAVSRALPEACLKEKIIETQACEKFMAQKILPEECRSSGVMDENECKKLLLKDYLDTDCRGKNIIDEEECRRFISERYAFRVECSSLDEISCREIITRRHLETAARSVKTAEKINSILEPFLNTSVTVRPFAVSPDTQGRPRDLESLEDIIPIAVRERTKITILHSISKSVLQSDERLASVPAGIAVNDIDGDFLPDDAEERLGTDLRNPDSDGDGYSDGLEVANRFDPLGQGSMKNAPHPIDESFAKRAVIEQPKVSGKFSSALSIQSVKNINTENTEAQSALRNGFQIFSGKAAPGQVIGLYIYSDLPLLVTAAADAYGNWSYTLKEPLRDGEHEVYVTVNDNTGKILEKSEPFAFFVQTARAVTVEEFFVERLSSKSSIWGNIKIYLLLAGLITLIGILMVIYFLLRSSRKRYG